MSAATTASSSQKVVDKYFALIKDLRNHKEGSVEKLVDLWDEDGIFEFAGAPPVTGTFRGLMAIHTLYKNRFQASGMPLKLEADSAKKKNIALGVVDTEVHRTRMLGGSAEKIVAGWTTRLSTDDGRGFNVSGAHTFTFKNGKISTLKVVISPKPDSAPKLAIEGLTVNDIGRLALAAWPVV